MPEKKKSSASSAAAASSTTANSKKKTPSAQARSVPKASGTAVKSKDGAKKAAEGKKKKPQVLSQETVSDTDMDDDDEPDGGSGSAEDESGSESGSESGESASEDGSEDEEAASQPTRASKKPARKTSEPDSALAYEPPKSYSRLDPADLPRNHPFSAENLKGKEIWYITAPVGAPLSKLQSVDPKDVLAGNPVLERKNASYCLQFDTEEEGQASVELLVPDGKGEYRVAAQPIAKSLCVLETLPKAPVVDTQPKAKPMREQPEGLRMRYTPFGATEVDSEARESQDTTGAVKKKKRSRESLGEGGEAKKKRRSKDKHHSQEVEVA